MSGPEIIGSSKGTSHGREKVFGSFVGGIAGRKRHLEDRGWMCC